ncbi:tail fiber domain-containing protein, partial [Streptococcus pneumoniae]|nr:tail fiber domain-containing protein [Streptococcus pneumoniae]
VLKRTIANDIRPKQAQAEAEIAKQVEVLSRTKNELSGVKSAQATYEETTTRRLSELTNLANGKASKSELTQTAEELSSKIASVQVGGRNYIRGTKRMMLARGLWASGTFRPSGAGTAKTIDVSDSPVTGFDKAIRLTSSNARDQIGIAQDGFYISQGTYTMSCWVKGRRGQKVKLQTYWQVNDNSGISPIFTLKDENWTKLSFTSARNRAGVASIGYVYLVNAEVGEYLDVLAPQLEDGSLATSSKEAPEDIEGQISTVESTFKQRANSLDAGVRSLTEGLRTKVDISSLNVTAENIRQSVKRLETDTQNKLNQKLSQAEFEVRAGSIRQEILNATKDKASKSELTQTAEELSSKIASVQASGRNLFLNSLFKQDISKTGIWTTSTYTAAIDSESKYLGHKALKIIGLNPSGRDGGNPKVTYPALGQFGKVIPGSTTNQDVTISFYAKANKNGIMLRSRLGNIGYKTGNVTLSTEIKRYVVHIPKGWTNESKQTTNEWLFNFNQEGTVWIWMPKFEISDVDTSYSEAPEDIEGQISTVESTFKQRANSLEAGVNRLTEGLRTKVDISALNVTAENIRQSVKSLETDTQNKLNQKLSQAEFEVRAGSIRQEILNATKDKASKSELTQTAEELSSKIASVQVGGINLLRNTASLLIGDRSKGCWMSTSGGNGRAISVEVLDPPKKMIKNMIRVIENTNGGNKDLTQLVGLRIGEKYTISCYARIASDSPNANVNLLFRSWANNTDLNRKFQKSISHKNWQKYSFTFTADAIENSIQFGQSGAGIIEICAPKIESGTLATDYSEAPEDIEGQISTVESTFKQRANSLDAGVSRLTEGLRTKVDISALNVTAENIRQSVKSLETDTQNKLNQKLSQAEFEVRAGSIRQEILNATKDKADKTLVVSEAGKLREEFSSLRVGGTNLLKGSKGPFLPDRKPANFDNNVLYAGQTSIYMEQDQKYIISAKTNGNFTAHHDGNKESDNVVLWIMDKNVRNYQIVSDLKTGTIGTKFIWNNPTGIYHLRVNTYHKEATKSVWDVKIEKGNVATDWSPSPEDAEGLITEAKATFERTTQGLRTDLSAIQEYVNKDGQRQEALQRYTREESAKQATAVRELVNRDFVGKASYQEDVRGIERRFDAITNPQNGSIATQIAKYKTAVDGRFSDITSLIAGKANQTDFQRVRETSQLYERILGNTNNSIADNVARMAMTNQLFQVEVSKNEGLKTVQRQLAGSWAVQNINSAGDLISGINLGANGYNRFDGKLTHITGETLIDKAVIKSAMVDKLKTANFEAGSVTTVVLDAEAVTADKVRFDAAFIRKMIANDAFIDQLTSKRIFSTKVESVISSSTFLEAYQGRIGGFTLGQFDQGGGRWISGVNQFSVGMGNGAGYGVRTAFWANWGNNWNYAGPKAWNVNTDGKMYCRNEVGFYDQVDFSNSSRANFYGNTTFSRSPVFSNGIELGSKDVLGDGWNPKGGRNAVVWWNQVGSGSLKYWMEQKSDRRLKENITDTAVKALDKINRLRMVAFDFIENKKHEEIGLIAQEAETIVPRIVSRDPENPDGYLHIDYTALVPYLIKAIQELNQKIEKMEKTIA